MPACPLFLLSRSRVRGALGIVLATAALGMALAAGAAPTFVQANAQSGNAVRAVSTVAFTAAQTAGDVNVVFIGWQGAAASLVSVVDSAGNVYSKAGAVSYGTTAAQAVYYTHAIVGMAAGTNTVTATFGAKVQNPDLRVVEYSGIDPNRPLDTWGGHATTGTPATSGAVSTTSANDILVASNFSQQSITGAGAGFTLRLKDAYSQIIEDETVGAVGAYTATAPQTKSGWFLMQLIALRAASAPPVAVPNVVGQSQSAAVAALAAAGLKPGSVATQSSSTVAAGYVISESPTAGSSAAAGTSVNLVVSNGPAMVSVPNLTGETQSAASSALTALGLIVGTVTSQTSATIPSGTLIGWQPAAGTSVAPGSAVSLVVSSGPGTVAVPQVAGLAQAAASAALTSAGLALGSVTQQSSTVAAGSVIGSTPAGGTTVSAGSAVSLLVSSGVPAGPPPVAVPNLVGSTQAAATSALTALGLVLGSVTPQSSSAVASGSVISSSPAAGASVASGTSVGLVVSTGAPSAPPPLVTVPAVAGQSQSAATVTLTAAGLALGAVTTQSSTTVATGIVIGSSPTAGASVASGSPVGLLVSTGAPASQLPATAPYPQSTIVAGIAWNESSKQRYASGSDIWDSVWASDGFVYGFWGDGNGFSSPAKKQIGMSQLAGSPDSGSITGTDVYLGTASPRPGGCGQKATVGGKPHGEAALANGVIYLFHSTYDLCTSQSWLARSLDNGVTWTDDVGAAAWPDANGFDPVAVLQTGPGQTGALMPDSTFVPYLYVYGGKSGGAAGSQYLARVPAFPANSIETPSNWSYYAGVDGSGNPIWVASSAQASPVWTDPNYAESIGVTFDAALGRYIAYNDHGTDCGGSPCERQVSLFDAPTPWGPWTTFDYEENFDNANCGGSCLGNQEAVGWAMMQKFFSADGLSFWVEYSSVNAYDSLNLIKGTMSLAPGSTVSQLAVSTSTPAVLDRLGPSGSGNLEFIDSSARLSSIPASYVGDEVIRLARNDAAVTDTVYVSFNNATAQNVCVAWNTANPPPSWLAGWSPTGQSLVGDATFAVYSAPYPAGSVSLPGPGSADAYILFVGCP